MTDGILQLLQVLMEIIPRLILTVLVIVIILGAFLKVVGGGASGKSLGFFKSLFGLVKPEVFSREEGAKFNKPNNILSPRNKGLLIDGDTKRLTPERSYSGLALNAPPNSGKSTRYVFSNLFAQNEASLVATDPSGELLEGTSGDLMRRGYEIWILDPSQPEQSHRFNPLSKIRRFSDVQEVSEVIVKSANPEFAASGKDAYWNQGAQRIIEVMIQTLQCYDHGSHLNLGNVLYLLQNAGGRAGGAVDSFIAEHAPEATFNQWKGILSGNPNTVSSHFSTAINSLAMLANPDLAWLTSKDELDFSELRQRKIALFIVLPSEKVEYYSFITSLFYTQLFNALVAKRPTPRDRDIYVFMDEFGNSGTIPRFDSIVTTIRKYRVSISIVVQSFSQLITQFGRERAETILEGGMSNKLFLPGTDTRTASMVEKMLGKKVVRKYGWGGKVTTTESNLLNADRISRLDKDEAIFFSGNDEPVLLKTKPYFQVGRFNRRSKLPPIDLPDRTINPISYVPL